MIALTLAAMAILTMIGIFIGGLRLLATGKERAVATGLGRELMEQIRIIPYAELIDGTYRGQVDPPIGNLPPPPYPQITVDNMEYIYTVTVATLRPGLKSITLEVQWRNDSEVILQTYVAGGG